MRIDNSSTIHKFTIGDAINYILLAMVGIVCLYPFIYVLTISFIPIEEYLKGGIYLYPKRISLDAYRIIFQNNNIINAFKSSVLITVSGTFMNMVLTLMCAYVLSKTKLKGYKIFINLIVFTMYFSGGLIPTYMLMKNLHLTEGYGAVVFTYTISVYFMLIIRTFFINLPESLEEAAIIDGGSEIYVFIKIVIPLSMPVIAAFGLFYAVSQWNQFFWPLIYINNRDMWPIQVLLREILFESTESMRELGAASVELQSRKVSAAIRMATVVVAVLPIAMVYPFLQKYFVKGVMIGAIKA